jgi:hypothetical protein
MPITNLTSRSAEADPVATEYLGRTIHPALFVRIAFSYPGAKGARP